MTEPALKQPAVGHPSVRQSQAANPLMNHWVGASAGTGKTKVLIDRVLRLMLPRAGLPEESATPPERILCLTFTKTGAAEMSNRIYAVLAGWSVMEDAALDAELVRLAGETPSDAVRGAARRLFARVLDAPGGLRILTIHSFCQSVLRRFPVEASLAPHFEVMDERTALEYLDRCLHDVIAAAQREPQAPLARAFDALALLLGAEEMRGLMMQVMARRSLLSGILNGRGVGDGEADGMIAAIHARLGVEEGETEEGILTDTCAADPARERELRQALEALLGGGAEDGKKATAMQPWLENPARRIQALAQYKTAFLTNEGTPRARMATKGAIAAYPDIVRVMSDEAQRLIAAEARLQSLRLAKANAALFTVSAEVMSCYERHKRRSEKLDYDDLIIKTAALLSETGAAEWVLYKLDGGIDHILVDEAQDTSPAQWRVIAALADEFFAGEGVRPEVTRTLFVVGDEKQSIFSFQGADPAAFSRMQAFFGDKALALQDKWEILLEHSFRSARAVLEVVDGVFARDAARRGVVSDLSRAVQHIPFRAGQAGLVELWPLVRAGDGEVPEAWAVPVDIHEEDNAKAMLAQKIAGTIRGWLDSGEMLPSRARRVRAGDVLILVQSRGDFVALLMRALKDASVPVAGIDRMTLTEEMAVMDLVAAAQFALQPDDDLTLAALLKSPLVGLNEEELYDLCHGRKFSLWRVVKQKRPALAAMLDGWVWRAGAATPYEFLAGILSAPCHADAVSGRRAFHGRLGPDIDDALDEFLNVALYYEQGHSPSLQKFVDWFRRGEAEVKREQAQHGEDQARIMTTHGAKGLQSPIVFLPDTTRKMHDHSRGRPRLLWPEDENGVPLWSPRSEFDAPAYAAARDAATARQDEEYRRLLYVALTRAEDRLYVCGWRGRKGEPKDDCWYNLVAAAFPPGDADSVRSLSSPQEAPPEPEKKTREKAAAVRQPLPSFAFEKPEQEETPALPLAPSRPGEDEPAARGPLAENQDWRFRRGVVAHQALEILPQLPSEKWEAALSAYLTPRVPEKDRAAFAAEILAVLRHPDFAPIFGPGSRAEVPVVGLAGKKYVVSGQMDRILVKPDAVLVVDYKTNRPPPRDPAAVPALYLTQMAAYRAVLRAVYPERPVKCALLWTDGPFLMPLPDEALDSRVA
jgi:ATP-dependent helicase/nuclease subunit A